MISTVKSSEREGSGLSCFCNHHCSRAEKYDIFQDNLSTNCCPPIRGLVVQFPAPEGYMSALQQTVSVCNPNLLLVHTCVCVCVCVWVFGRVCVNAESCCQALLSGRKTRKALNTDPFTFILYI